MMMNERDSQSNEAGHAVGATVLTVRSRPCRCSLFGERWGVYIVLEEGNLCLAARVVTDRAGIYVGVRPGQAQRCDETRDASTVNASSRSWTVEDRGKLWR